MKNLAIKQIALGLVLAGFAAGSAYAVTSATTKNTIVGNPPTIKSTKTPTAGKYSYVVKRGGVDISTLADAAKNARVGDTVVVTFTYADADGDESDPDWLAPSGNKKPTEKLVFGISGGSSTITTFVTSSAPKIDGTSANYEFLIPSEAAGKGLTIALTPISEFGDPWAGTPISGNLFSADNSDNPNPPPNDCTTDPSKCISPETEGLRVDIYNQVSPGTKGDLYGSSDSDANGAITLKPTIGQTFMYTVTDTLNNNADVTTQYAGQWRYTGTNTNALGTQTAAGSVSPASATVGSTYKVDINASDTLSTGNSYVAGGQGFTLQVDVTKVP